MRKRLERLIHTVEKKGFCTQRQAETVTAKATRDTLELLKPFK